MIYGDIWQGNKVQTDEVCLPIKNQWNNDDGDFSLFPDASTISRLVTAVESALKSDYAGESAHSPSSSDPQAQYTETAATETSASTVVAAVIVPAIPPLMSFNGVQQTKINPHDVAITSELE